MSRNELEAKVVEYIRSDKAISSLEGEQDGIKFQAGRACDGTIYFMTADYLNYTAE